MDPPWQTRMGCDPVARAAVLLSKPLQHILDVLLEAAQRNLPRLRRQSASGPLHPRRVAGGAVDPGGGSLRLAQTPPDEGRRKHETPGHTVSRQSACAL